MRFANTSLVAPRKMVPSLAKDSDEVVIHIAMSQVGWDDHSRLSMPAWFFVPLTQSGPVHRLSWQRSCIRIEKTSTQPLPRSSMHAIFVSKLYTCKSFSVRPRFYVCKRPSLSVIQTFSLCSLSLLTQLSSRVV